MAVHTADIYKLTTMLVTHNHFYRNTDQKNSTSHFITSNELQMKEGNGRKFML
jgi:hypothetical protein